MSLQLIPFQPPPGLPGNIDQVYTVLPICMVRPHCRDHMMDRIHTHTVHVMNLAGLTLVYNYTGVQIHLSLTLMYLRKFLSVQWPHNKGTLTVLLESSA